MYKKLTKIIPFFCSNSKNTPDNHFGFTNVPTQSKQSLVNEVFHSVANQYDIMNDLMSAGVHRYWKNYFVHQLGNLSPSNLYTYPHSPQTIQILDVAGGTGDISFKILNNHHHSNIKTTVLDVNQSMLDEGYKRSKQLNLGENEIQFVCANAEELPFQDNTFDAYTISFGLRNVPRTRKALEQAKRVLKRGGRFMCLQFSKVQNPIFSQFYKQYSFHVIPQIGNLITGDKNSYKYLVESIQRFLTQQQLKNMMDQVGFIQTSYTNLTNGIVAIHSGYKFD